MSADERGNDGSLRSELLEALLGQADGLREEREELKERIAREKDEVLQLEQRLVKVRQQVKLKLGNTRWIVGVLVVMAIGAKIAYESLPTEINLRFSGAEFQSDTEAERLLKMLGLRVRRLKTSGAELSFLLRDSDIRHEKLKVRHFLDRLIKARRPKDTPAFTLRGPPKRRLVLEFQRNWVEVLDKPKLTGRKSCVWAVPARVAGLRGEFISDEMMAGGLEASSPEYQGVADRLTGNGGWYLYMRSKHYTTHIVQHDKDAHRSCNYGVLLGADDRFLTLVFPMLARGLDSYSLGKALF